MCVLFSYTPISINTKIFWKTNWIYGVPKERPVLGPLAYVHWRTGIGVRALSYDDVLIGSSDGTLVTALSAKPRRVRLT